MSWFKTQTIAQQVTGSAGSSKLNNTGRLAEWSHRLIARLLFLIFSLVLLLMLLLVSGCSDGKDELADSNQELNRLVFNQQLKGLEQGVVISKNYRTAVPKFWRDRISNFTTNLTEPRRFFASLLQMKGEKTVRSFFRFILNSTLGLFGMFDLFTPLGTPPADEDFGQVLAIWGVPAGEYIYLPLVGPSSSRDFIGGFLDLASHASVITTAVLGGWWAPSLVAIPLERFNNFTKIADIAKSTIATSLDPYTGTKIFYHDFRRNQIYDGAPPLDFDIYDIID